VLYGSVPHNCVKQDRQRAYKVTLRHLHAALLQRKRNKYCNSGCVFVDLVKQNDVCASYYVVICGLSGSTEFFHTVSLTAWFSKSVIEHKICFDFL